MNNYFPGAVFTAGGLDSTTRVLVSPARYIQGPGVLAQAGSYFQTLDWSHAGILASARGLATQGETLMQALGEQGIQASPCEFQGECSLEEIEARAADLRAAKVQGLVALGGGKCVDAGKCIAQRLDVPLVVIPTLASNDAPCSAVSVLYTPDGVVCGAEFFKSNPVMVIVDTQVICEAPARYLVAGMGDAMATWYEARVCAENREARNILGVRPTLTAQMVGQLCATTLYNQGAAAVQALRAGVPDAALEDIVEANTLLSGLGFESGGLAAAHGYAQGFTTLPHVEETFLHGEMVAMGVLGQLALEKDLSELDRAGRFFAACGLPVCLRQLGVDHLNVAQVDSVVAGAMEFAPIHNFAFEVTPATVKAALLEADQLGESLALQLGDAPWQALHTT